MMGRSCPDVARQKDQKVSELTDAGDTACDIRVGCWVLGERGGHGSRRGDHQQ